MTPQEIFIAGACFGWVTGVVFFWTLLKITGKEIVDGRSIETKEG